MTNARNIGAGELEMRYNARRDRSGTHFIRAEFDDDSNYDTGYDEYVPTFYFSNLEDVARFARKMFIADVHVKITYIQFNLNLRAMTGR